MPDFIRRLIERLRTETFDADRRRFHLSALTGLVGGGALLSTGGCGPSPVQESKKSAIKIAAQLPGNPTMDDLTLVKQLGVDYVTMGGRTADGTATLENYRRLVSLVEGAGMKIWNIGNRDVHNMEEVTLNLPGRDGKIEEYKEFLRNLHGAGLTYTTYAHMGNGIWSTAREATRGGASARAFDLAKADAGYWNGKRFEAPLTHGRRYSEDEIWENYTYFIKKVVPLAEALNIRIGIHPDDPPVPELGGVPRCIFGNFEGYKRAMEIADSDNVGLCLCVGCWLEGGDYMGKDILETIRYFGERGKIFKVHFRNVNAPLPHFMETFMDNGYRDMYPIMKALVEVGFDGVIIADHWPQMIGGRDQGLTYSIAYMHALLHAAVLEVEGTA